MAIAIAEVFVPKDIDPLSKRYGDSLREIRREKNIKHRILADRLGMAESTYRAYEQGYRRIRLDQIRRFASAYDMAPEELTARLGLSDLSLREIRVAECADIMGQLADEPPEVAETIIRWLRESVNLAKRRRSERTN